MTIGAAQRRPERTDGGTIVRLGHPLVAAYLELVGAHARPNTLLAVAYDLRVFFSFVREVARLRRRVEDLEVELDKKNKIIEVQGKLSSLSDCTQS